MFGTNRVYGRSDYKEADSLLVTSIFLTLQGEGPFQGQPALFIRLTGCQLRCAMCDTFFDEGNWFTHHALLTRAIGMIRTQYGTLSKCGIVITGGEPSLQENIADFLLNCHALGVKYTQIETNGILPINRLPSATQIVVSPKCNERAHKYYEPNKKTLEIASCLKFVVSADIESPYHSIPAWAFEWQRATDKPIYISPMNMYREEFLQKARDRIKERREHDLDYRSTVDEVISAWDDNILDREKNRINHNYAAKYALRKGVYLTLQMQLYASIA